MQKEPSHPFTAQLLQSCDVFKKFPVEVEDKEGRECLPHDMLLTEKNMIWTMLKENIGKDLWAITMPVTFNEPLSFLQRINEHLEYSELLRKANKSMDPNLRLALVFGHSYMMFSNTISRINKTFNPLLGETYEYIDKDLRCISEQVSHHPPVAAYHAECKDFVLTGNFLMKTELKLTSFKLVPTGETTVILKGTGEKFTLTKPKSRLHNYMMGKMYVWYEGKMECVNEDTRERLEVDFKKKGWTSSGDYKVSGSIFNDLGREACKVEGDWRENLQITDIKTKKTTLVCSRKPEPANCERQYSFTNFAIQSNFLNQSMLNSIAPTDSRLRPDIRAYEYGEAKLAGEFKKRVEESQRSRRKQLQEQEKTWSPLWFEFSKEDDKIKSRFRGEYWKCRETGQWPKEMLDLYN